MHTLNAESVALSKESILYKGRSGSGKTTNAFSWPGPIKAAYFDKNLKTAANAILGSVDGELMVFDDFRDFQDNFVTQVLNQKFEAETIIVDTWDFAAGMLLQEIQGHKMKMAISDWGVLLNRQRQAMLDLSSAVGRYNLVVCCHQMDVTNDDGALLKVVPKIPGQFKDELEDYFDTVLICESRVTSQAVKKEGGGMERVASKEFICHTVPPTPYDSCKGGGLPPTVGGTYSELMKAWGRTG